MKRFSIALVLLACFAAVPLFAWEPEDLTKFPKGQESNDIILDIGVGLDYDMFGSIGKNYIYVPPIRATLDFNVPLGDKGLPFFIGGAFGFSGSGHKDPDWFFGRISIGGRFGYHFNWDVENLDTYAVTSLGWIIYTGDGMSDQYKHGWPLFGVNVGARYFVTDWFGFWAELGYTSLSVADIGIAFKF